MSHEAPIKDIKDVAATYGRLPGGRLVSLRASQAHHLMDSERVDEENARSSRIPLCSDRS